MTGSTSTLRVIERQTKPIDFKKIIDILCGENIIDRNFTGALHIDFNRGGIAACKKIETLK